jgi:hypothetical protein
VVREREHAIVGDEPLRAVRHAHGRAVLGVLDVQHLGVGQAERAGSLESIHQSAFPYGVLALSRARRIAEYVLNHAAAVRSASAGSWMYFRR